MIKASAGGGGKGMRGGFGASDLERAIISAKNKKRHLVMIRYIWKLIINPKHVEFQILADKYGNIIHLGERDCSVQQEIRSLWNLLVRL